MQHEGAYKLYGNLRTTTVTVQTLKWAFGMYAEIIAQCL